MTFIFRADASLEIGTGHVVRSLAVAEALSRMHYEVALVGTVIDLPWLMRLIRDSVFISPIVPSDFKPSTRDFFSSRQLHNTNS